MDDVNTFAAISVVIVAVVAAVEDDDEDDDDEDDDDVDDDDGCLESFQTHLRSGRKYAYRTDCNYSMM